MYTENKGEKMLADSGRDNSLETIGGRIRASRKARGLKLTTTAELCGLSRTSFAQWENGGVKNPDMTKLGKFVRLVDVSLDWLIDRKGPDPDLTPPTGRKRRAVAAAAVISAPESPEAHEINPSIPEIAGPLNAHASKIDFSAKALWTIPSQVLEIGFNSVLASTCIQRVVARGQTEVGLSRGDYILIDISRNRIDEPGIYIVADPEGISARRILVVDKAGKLEVSAVADDLERESLPESVDKLNPMGRVMGIFRPA